MREIQTKKCKPKPHASLLWEVARYKLKIL